MDAAAPARPPRTVTRARAVLLAGLLVVLAAAWWWRGVPGRADLDTIHLPRGFSIGLFADSLPAARSLALGGRGTVFVGVREGAAVFALRDVDGDGVADSSYRLEGAFRAPNGVAFYDGALYVADISRIWRFDAVEGRLASPPPPVLVTAALPEDLWHGLRYLAIGPDGLLYAGSGAPCNVCLRDDEHAATILQIDPASGAVTVYARGVRNSVGFDWHPRTGELWFTDNGRDRLGENTPPDELNRATEPGRHYGFPYCHGGDIPDPDFTARTCGEFTPPVARLGPHVAALGMRFYNGAMFPARYRERIFIAEHGSWNRVVPIGYRVTMVWFEGGTPRYEVFADGWLSPVRRSAWGRPVDVLVMPDGALLVSDDQAGAVYRIVYGG